MPMSSTRTKTTTSRSVERGRIRRARGRRRPIRRGPHFSVFDSQKPPDDVRDSEAERRDREERVDRVDVEVGHHPTADHHADNEERERDECADEERVANPSARRTEEHGEQRNDERQHDPRFDMVFLRPLGFVDLRFGRRGWPRRRRRRNGWLLDDRNRQGRAHREAVDRAAAERETNRGRAVVDCGDEVVCLEVWRDVLAKDVVGAKIRELSFGAFSRLDAHLALDGRDEEEHAVVELGLTDVPRGGRRVGGVFDRAPVERRRNEDRDVILRALPIGGERKDKASRTK